MAESLSAFFNPVPVEKEKMVVSKRFVRKDGKPEEWEIGCITAQENSELQKICMKRVPVPGRRNQFTYELDYPLYNAMLCARCTLYPDLNNAELQNHFGVMGADKLLLAMLNAGEYADYIIKVTEVNGFDTSMEEKVEEAKNS